VVPPHITSRGELRIYDGQGTLTVLYRQTSFGTFGGGPAANISCPCMYIRDISCCNSGDKDTPGGSAGSCSPPGSTIDGPCDNGIPGGNVGGHVVPGANTTPGGGPPGGGGGAGKSLA
jgi:hypothetical protein